MNPPDMRELFQDALAEPEPTAQADADDIVAAGRRSHRRRRAARIGSGALAGVAAVALVATAPLVLGQGEGTTAQPIAADGGDTATDAADCPDPADEMTEEQKNTAEAHWTALEEYVQSIGGELVDTCYEGLPEHDGFYYDSEFGGYRFGEAVRFPDTGEEVKLFIDVRDTAEESTEEEAEWVITCRVGDGMTCPGGDAPEGVLLDTYDMGVLLNGYDGGTEDAVESASRVLAFRSGATVDVWMSIDAEYGVVSTQAEQLGELGTALSGS